MTDAVEARNTDRELWREREGDYYSPALFVTEGGGIGIDVGGNVVVRPIREWHKLSASELAWKILYKQESRWSNLPQSEREAALQKALEDEVAAGAAKDDEIERLRIEIAAIGIYDKLPYDGPAGTAKPAWIPFGNSLKQDEARQQAGEQINR